MKIGRLVDPRRRADLGNQQRIIATWLLAIYVVLELVVTVARYALYTDRSVVATAGLAISSAFLALGVATTYFRSGGRG